MTSRNGVEFRSLRTSQSDRILSRCSPAKSTFHSLYRMSGPACICLPKAPPTHNCVFRSTSEGRGRITVAGNHIPQLVGKSRCCPSPLLSLHCRPHALHSLVKALPSDPSIHYPLSLVFEQLACAGCEARDDNAPSLHSCRLKVRQHVDAYFRIYCCCSCTRLGRAFRFRQRLRGANSEADIVPPVRVC